MRWWLRIVVTLALAPIAWLIVVGYLGIEQGGALASEVATSGKILLQVYVAYTLPALVLVCIVLIPAELLLRLVGADLLIVAIAPLLAVLVPTIVGHVVAIKSFAPTVAILLLAFVHGLVFGLTIREPREPTRARPAT